MEHGDDPSWHYFVESTVLVAGGDVAGMFTALDEVNCHFKGKIGHDGEQLEDFEENLVYIDDGPSPRSVVQEIRDAVASPKRKFYEKYHNKEDWFAKGIHKFLNQAIENVKTSCLSQLKKQLSIADSKHSPEFLSQIKYHYESNDEEPEIQQEKLWILTTSSMSIVMKVKWLEKWNESTHLGEAMKFSKPQFNDSTFSEWLCQATWWDQVFEGHESEHRLSSRQRRSRTIFDGVHQDCENLTLGHYFPS